MEAAPHAMQTQEQEVQTAPSKLKTAPMMPSTKPAIARPLPGAPMGELFIPFAANTIAKIDKINVIQPITIIHQDNTRPPATPRIPQTSAAIDMFLLLSGVSGVGCG